MLIVCVGVMGVLLASGCGTPEDKAESVVKKMFNSMNDGDFETMVDCIDIEGMMEGLKKGMPESRWK